MLKKIKSLIKQIIMLSKEEKKIPKLENTTSDIIVSGIDKIKVNLASCCDPVYGDDIVGFITKGNGISIHRSSCQNLAMMADRLIEVSWSDKKESKYGCDLVVYSNTSDNKLTDITILASKLDVNLSGVKMISRGNNTVYEMQCFVKDLPHLQKLMKELEKESYIKSVERLMR